MATASPAQAPPTAAPPPTADARTSNIERCIEGAAWCHSTGLKFYRFVFEKLNATFVYNNEGEDLRYDESWVLTKVSKVTAAENFEESDDYENFTNRPQRCIVSIKAAAALTDYIAQVQFSVFKMFQRRHLVPLFVVNNSPSM